jgi:hypothetical protein
MASPNYDLLFATQEVDENIICRKSVVLQAAGVVGLDAL